VFLFSSLNAEFSERLRIPASIFGGEDVQVKVGGVNHVNQVSERACHKVASHAEFAGGRQRAAVQFWLASHALVIHLRSEIGLAISAEDQHVRLVELDSCARHSPYKIRLTKFETLPLLGRNDASVRSAGLVSHV